MTPIVTLEAISHDAANVLWRRIVADLDLYACFGRDTDPEIVAGDWWGALQEDGVTVGLVWLTPWIKDDESVIAIGRALLPEYRYQKHAAYHRDAIQTKIKEVFPKVKTSIGLVYSTNPASLKATLNRKGTRLVGAVPFGEHTLYIFVFNEWKD